LSYTSEDGRDSDNILKYNDKSKTGRILPDSSQ